MSTEYELQAEVDRLQSALTSCDRRRQQLQEECDASRTDYVRLQQTHQREVDSLRESIISVATDRNDWKSRAEQAEEGILRIDCTWRSAFLASDEREKKMRVENNELRSQLAASLRSKGYDFPGYDDVIKVLQAERDNLKGKVAAMEMGNRTARAVNEHLRDKCNELERKVEEAERKAGKKTESVGRYTVHDANTFHPELGASWYILRNFNAVPGDARYACKETAEKVAEALEAAERRTIATAPSPTVPTPPSVRVFHLWHTVGAGTCYAIEDSSVRCPFMEPGHTCPRNCPTHFTSDGSVW